MAEGGITLGPLIYGSSKFGAESINNKDEICADESKEWGSARACWALQLGPPRQPCRSSSHETKVCVPGAKRRAPGGGGPDLAHSRRRRQWREVALAIPWLAVVLGWAGQWSWTAPAELDSPSGAGVLFAPLQ